MWLAIIVLGSLAYLVGETIAEDMRDGASLREAVTTFVRGFDIH
ncbi:MAG TPA: hypothetical protein VIL45_07090 [Thermoplasmata archaeon]